MRDSLTIIFFTKTLKNKKISAGVLQHSNWIGSNLRHGSNEYPVSFKFTVVLACSYLTAHCSRGFNSSDFFPLFSFSVDL